MLQSYRNSPALQNPTFPKLRSHQQPESASSSQHHNPSPSPVSLLSPLLRGQSLLHQIEMASLASKDASLLAFAKKLKDVEEVLDNLVDDYSDLSRAKGVKLDDGSSVASVSSQLNLSDVLSYAGRISYTTFAPPEFGAGQAPLRRSLPPAPQEEQMRASQLYNFANIDVGLPKTVIEPPLLVPTEAYQAPNLGALQGRLPPHFTMPSGWRPGMPVELPEGPVLPQEPIQVRPVQLDILDDQDNDSSDEGSSEEED